MLDLHLRFRHLQKVEQSFQSHSQPPLSSRWQDLRWYWNEMGKLEQGLQRQQKLVQGMMVSREASALVKTTNTYRLMQRSQLERQSGQR